MIRKLFLVTVSTMFVAACDASEPLAPTDSPDDGLLVVAAAPASDACWGQASKVFARLGEMGTHSSEQSTPRVGLRNLARALYEQGVIPADTMEALGAFVASELGLSIDACMT